mmetsp:Transcript_32441/g.50524  ORF Transcript_32441/g.50524 Transcript_32441/m.50524 type:complete len:149 (+) Transcript_32441:20-466(+)
MAHARSNAAEVNDLWSQFPDLLTASKDLTIPQPQHGIPTNLALHHPRSPDSSGSVPTQPLHPTLAAGILSVSGVIHPDLQLALLTRGGEVQEERVSGGWHHAIRLVRGGIESLVQQAGDTEVPILLAPGEFRDLVLNEVKEIKALRHP